MFLKLDFLMSCSPSQVQVKQLAIQAYEQWDQLEEVVNEMALAANKSLIPYHQEQPTSSGIPASNEISS